MAQVKVQMQTLPDAQAAGEGQKTVRNGSHKLHTKPGPSDTVQGRLIRHCLEANRTQTPQLLVRTKKQRQQQEAGRGKGEGVMLWTWRVPSGVRRRVPCTRMDVPVEVKTFSPPTSAATSVLTNTCMQQV